MKTIKALGLIILMASVVACNDTSSDPSPSDKNNDDGPVEGAYAGTWLLSNEDMPTPEMKADLEKLILVVDEEDRYTWTWVKKTGQETVFEGLTTYQKTNHKHTSGASIWRYSIIVDKINGEWLPGGWDGIFTFEGADHLVVNVEPSVSQWEKWPEPEEGVGSGQSGQKSVYRFVRQ